MVIFLSIFVAYMLTENEIEKRNGIWQAEEKEVSLLGSISKIQENEYGWNIYVEQVTLEKQVTIENVKYAQFLVQCDDKPDVKIGNKIYVTGELKQFEMARNYGNFDSRKYYMSLGIYGKVKADKLQLVDYRYDSLRENLYQLRCLIVEKLKNICDVSKINSGITKYFFNVCKGKDSIFSAILLGDKSEMDGEIKDLYSVSGIAHILAISGLHISFIGMFVYTLLRKRFKFAVSSAISMVLVISFGLMSGMGIATIRAVVMFGLKLLGEVLGRTYDYLTAISTAGIMLMLYNPFVIFHSGFQMSFAAIIAITLVWPMVCNILGIETKARPGKRFLKECIDTNDIGGMKSKIKRVEWTKEKAKDIFGGLKKSLLFGLNVGMVMNPIIAFYYYQLPTYSFLLNIIVVPLMSVVIVSGMAGITLSFMNIWLGRLGILPGCVILELYTFLCKVVSVLPFSNVIVGKPSIGLIIAYYVMLTSFLLVTNYIRSQRNREERKKNEVIAKEGRKIEGKKIRSIRLRKVDRRFRRLSLIICVILNFLIYNPAKELFQEKNLEVTFLDVGQGDGIFVQTDNGTTITIDGGSTSVNQVGKYRIIPFMKAKGIKAINYAIVTHTDNDHISGLEEMLIALDNQGVRVKHLVMPDIPLKDETYQNLITLAREHKVKVLYISKGNKLKLGSVEFACRHPSLNTKSDDRNDYSTVLSVTYNQFSMLLTGDISSETEEKVMSTLQNHYTLLKVAHHGSKYSTSEAFLKKITPDYSMISVGEHNLYGHPSGETLERLKQSGSDIFRTDECGGVTVRTDGKKMRVKKMVEN